jgi:hypothetical protein
MSEQQIPLISTKEFAGLFRVKSATVRRSYCVNGHYLSMRPVKLPSGRLLWPNNLAQQLLQTENHGSE